MPSDLHDYLARDHDRLDALLADTPHLRRSIEHLLREAEEGRRSLKRQP